MQILKLTFLPTLCCTVWLITCCSYSEKEVRSVSFTLGWSVIYCFTHFHTWLISGTGMFLGVEYAVTIKSNPYPKLCAFLRFPDKFLTIKFSKSNIYSIRTLSSKWWISPLMPPPGGGKTHRNCVLKNKENEILVAKKHLISLYFRTYQQTFFILNLFSKYLLSLAASIVYFSDGSNCSNLQLHESL